MTKLMGYLGMDVGVMTTNDWLGVFFALVAAFGMAAVEALQLYLLSKPKQVTLQLTFLRT